MWNKFQIGTFSVLWLWIAIVSSFDAYLTIHLKDELPGSEQNPLARLIMEADNWNVSLFIGLKMFGTICGLGILVSLYYLNKKCAFSTIFILAMLQTLLLMYLLYDFHEGYISLNHFN